MFYLILGEDARTRDDEFAALRQRLILGAEAENFDLQKLSGRKLDPQELKKALVTLPAVAPQRLVLVRDAEKLDSRCKDLLLEFAEAALEHVVVVLDSGEWRAGDSFVKKISVHAKVIAPARAEKINVFAMTRQMSARRPADAVKTLVQLIEEGSHPLQIMGGLVWFWGKQKNRVNSQRFREGLRDLQEADLNIKRSRLKPEMAMEFLVVKLCTLLA